MTTDARPHEELDDHDLGLQHDLPTIAARERSWGRRALLGLVGGVGVAAVAGCATDNGTSGAGSTTPAAPPSGGPGDDAPPGAGMGADSGVEVNAGEIPEETAGPYPGDGSNGPNVLTESGIVRRDITTSFGSATGVAEGVPTTVRLRVYDLTGEEVTPLSGAAIYLWHCDREGRYSLYSDGVTEENYLRGVQVADDEGRLEFTTIFPACYSGRWPHMHFEVYASLEKATSADNKLRTSQLALPEEVCHAVYATEGYEQSVDNLASLSLDTDGIFADGHSLQMAKVTGSVDDGYSVTLNVPV